jgi:hypothetical protein
MTLPFYLKKGDGCRTSTEANASVFQYRNSYTFAPSVDIGSMNLLRVHFLLILNLSLYIKPFKRQEKCSAPQKIPKPSSGK